MGLRFRAWVGGGGGLGGWEVGVWGLGPYRSKTPMKSGHLSFGALNCAKLRPNYSAPPLICLGALNGEKLRVQKGSLRITQEKSFQMLSKNRLI